MNQADMLKRLKDGEKPIDVTIQKWIDISKTPSANIPRARHQLDEGKANCALCYFYKDCKICPLFLQYGVACDESNGVKGEKYNKDFYAQFRETGKAKIMLDALEKVKENIKNLDEKSRENKNHIGKEGKQKSSARSKKKASESSMNKKKFEAYKNPGVDEAEFVDDENHDVV